MQVAVILIIGLLITGLVIDLGGGPTGERIGFRVINHTSFPLKQPENTMHSTGKIPEPWRVRTWNPITLDGTAFLQFSVW